MLPRKIRDFVKGDPELTKIFELLYNKDDTFFDQGVFILECLLDERPDWGITVLGDLKQLYSSSNPLVNSTENDEALIFKIVISLLEMEDATIDACLQDIRDLRIGRVPTLSPALSKLSTTRLVFNAHYKVRKHSWSSRKRLILPTWLSQPESEPLKVNHVTVPEISSHYSSHPILKEVLQIFRPVSLSWKGVTLRKRTGFWTVDNCCTAEWTNLQFLIQEAKALDVESIHHNNCLYRVDLRTLNWDQVSPLRSISWIEPDFWMDTVQQIKLSEAVELPLRERVLEITVTSLTSLDKLQFPNVQTIRCLEYAERLTADTWKCFPKLAVIDFGTAQKKVYTSKPPQKSFTCLSEQKIRTWLRFRQLNLEKNIGWMSAKYFAAFIHCFTSEEQQLLFESSAKYLRRRRGCHYLMRYGWRETANSFYKTIVIPESIDNIDWWMYCQFLFSRIRLTTPDESDGQRRILQNFRKMYLENTDNKPAIQQHLQEVTKRNQFYFTSSTEDLELLQFFLQHELWGTASNPGVVRIAGSIQSLKEILSHLQQQAPETIPSFIAFLRWQDTLRLPVQYLSEELCQRQDGLNLGEYLFWDLRSLSKVEDITKYAIHSFIQRKAQANHSTFKNALHSLLRWPSPSVLQILGQIQPEETAEALCDRIKTFEDVVQFIYAEFLSILAVKQQARVLTQCIHLLRHASPQPSERKVRRFINRSSPYLNAEHLQKLFEISMVSFLWDDLETIRKFDIQWPIVQEKLLEISTQIPIQWKCMNLRHKLFLWSVNHPMVNQKYKYHKQYLQELHQLPSLLSLVHHQYNQEGLLYRGELTTEVCQQICDLSQDGVFIRFNPKQLSKWALWTQSNPMGWTVIEQNLQSQTEIDLYQWPSTMIERAISLVHSRVNNLKIRGCELTTLPNLRECTSLRKLFIYNNHLSDLSSENLPPDLSEISISNNAFTQLPESLRVLSKLEKIYCKGITPTAKEPLAEILIY